MIEKSAKVYFFFEKLTKTATKVEYLAPYFSSIVLYHLSLLFVNCFVIIVHGKTSCEYLKCSLNIYRKDQYFDKKSAPTNQCAPPCVRKLHGQSLGGEFPRQRWTWCITSPSVRLICGRTHYPLDCFRLDRYNQPRRFLCVGTRTARSSVKIGSGSFVLLLPNE